MSPKESTGARKKEATPPPSDDDFMAPDPVEAKVSRLQDEQKAKVIKAIQKLSRQSVVDLRKEFGIIIPVRILAPPRAERRWAYLCKRCLHQALEFVGLQFSYKSGDEWVVSDSPPLGVPIDDLPWVQDHPKASHHGKDPFNLRCQFCGGEVILNPDRSLVPKRVVLRENIEKMWERREREQLEKARRWGKRR